MAIFGFFESENNQEATNNLFSFIEKLCYDLGAEYLTGPFNPNYYLDLGILTRNFEEPPAFLESYNPPYYQQLIENYGFTTKKIIHTRVKYFVTQKQSENHILIPDFEKHKDYRIRKFNVWNYKKELDILRNIDLDIADEDLFLTVHRHYQSESSEKFTFILVRPKLFKIIEYKNEPVGYVQFVLNLNKVLNYLEHNSEISRLPGFINRFRKIKEVVIYSFAVKKEFQNAITSSMISHIIGEILQKYNVIYTGYKVSINSYADKKAEEFGIKPYKWFALYIKTIKEQAY